MRVVVTWPCSASDLTLGFAEERGLEEALTRMGGEGGGGETSDRSVSFTDQDGRGGEGERDGTKFVLCWACHSKTLKIW